VAGGDNDEEGKNEAKEEEKVVEEAGVDEKESLLRKGSSRSSREGRRGSSMLPVVPEPALLVDGSMLVVGLSG